MQVSIPISNCPRQKHTVLEYVCRSEQTMIAIMQLLSIIWLREIYLLLI